MIDSLGTRVKVGDTVQLWPEHRGRVVCSLDDAVFSTDYPESEWGYLKVGIIVELENGNIFHYSRPDEDFTVLSKDVRRQASR